MLAGATRRSTPDDRRAPDGVVRLNADVAEFLDEVMHEDASTSASSRSPGQHSPLAGHSVGEVDVPALPGASRSRAPAAQGRLPARPARGHRDEVGSTLIVFGSPEQVGALRTSAAG